MKTIPSIESKTPRFSWRAWLSLAPVLALIGIGSWIVLQEQRLARQEAQEALQLSANKLMEDLEKKLPMFAWFDGWSGVTEADIFKQDQTLFITVDLDGHCLLPPLVTKPPIPEPSVLPWSQLDESQILLWFAMQKAESREMLLHSVQAFQRTDPPEPFLSLSKFRKIAWMASDPQWSVSDVFDSIQTLRESLIGNPLTESGLPLSVALDIQELKIIHRVEYEHIFMERMMGFVERQVEHPSSWTYQILTSHKPFQEKPPVDEILLDFFPRRLAYQLEKREKARLFHHSIPVEKWSEWGKLLSSHPHWIEYQDTHYLLCRVFQGEVYHFVAIAIERLEQLFGNKLEEWFQASGSHQEFLFSFEILERSFLAVGKDKRQSIDQGKGEDFLDNVDSVITSGSHPWFKVRAEILNPESYFANSRKRTRSMLLLIGLAGVTGLIGWFAQRRAFRRQVELGRMKSNFVASVSHELRAPIASIRLMTENLSQQKSRTDSERQDYFQWIGLECRRLSSLVQNILQFSRLELGKREFHFEAVDIRRLFDETIKLMEPLAISAQVQLLSEVKQIPSDKNTPLHDALWDGQAIHQALVNLIDNGIKHTPKDGMVRVELNLKAEDGYVDFYVIDQGPGIDASDHERIFQPFERLGSEMTRKTKGVGIGLNVVWHTSQAHHGTVRVEQAPGGGACFILSLPLKPKQK